MLLLLVMLSCLQFWFSQLISRVMLATDA